MQWWNEFVAWLTASETRPVLFSAAVLAVAIIVAALLASGITKAAVRRLVAQRDREQKAAAIAALVDVSTEASVWYSLTPAEQVLADRAVGQADIHIRLLPIKGAPLAANWAAHQLAEMKRNSSTFGYELEPVVAEFRDRLIEWQNKPGRAKKIFEADLERWRFENTENERALISEQDKWSAKRHRSEHSDDKRDDVDAGTASNTATSTTAGSASVESPAVTTTRSDTVGEETAAYDTLAERDEPIVVVPASAAAASASADQVSHRAADADQHATLASRENTGVRGDDVQTDTQTQKLIDDVAALDTQLAAVRKDDDRADDSQRTA